MTMVFEFFHSSPAGGHVGILKTIGKIRQNFIWKGMDRNIVGRVRSCQLCALSKPAQNSQLSFLASEVAHHTKEKVFIDFVGLFERSKQGTACMRRLFFKVCLEAATSQIYCANTTVQAISQHFR